MNDNKIVITKENLEKYYNCPQGNLYYNDYGHWNCIVDFTIDEVKWALKNNIKIIYVEGKEHLVV